MDGCNDVYLIDTAVVSQMRHLIDTQMRKIGLVLHQFIIARFHDVRFVFTADPR